MLDYSKRDATKHVEALSTETLSRETLALKPSLSPAPATVITSVIAQTDSSAIEVGITCANARLGSLLVLIALSPGTRTRRNAIALGLNQETACNASRCEGNGRGVWAMRWAAVVHGVHGSGAPVILVITPLKHPVTTVNTFSQQECLQPAQTKGEVSRIARSVLKGSAAMCIAMQAARWGLRAMASHRGGHSCFAPSLPLRKENCTCQSALMLRPVSSSSAAAIHMDGWADRLLNGGIGAQAYV